MKVFSVSCIQLLRKFGSTNLVVAHDNDLSGQGSKIPPSLEQGQQNQGPILDPNSTSDCIGIHPESNHPVSRYNPDHDLCQSDGPSSKNSELQNHIKGESDGNQVFKDVLQCTIIMS